MQYISHYSSPLGEMLLAADKAGLTGLWFEGQKYFARSLEQEHLEQEIPVLTQAKEWLDLYFSGKRPDFEVPLHLTGTDFQNEVWEILRAVLMGRSRKPSRREGAWRICLPRRWAAQWGITPYL